MNVGQTVCPTSTAGYAHICVPNVLLPWGEGLGRSFCKSPNKNDLSYFKHDATRIKVKQTKTNKQTNKQTNNKQTNKQTNKQSENRKEKQTNK